MLSGYENKLFNTNNRKKKMLNFQNLLNPPLVLWIFSLKIFWNIACSIDGFQVSSHAFSPAGKRPVFWSQKTHNISWRHTVYADFLRI